MERRLVEVYGNQAAYAAAERRAVQTTRDLLHEKQPLPVILRALATERQRLAREQAPEWAAARNPHVRNVRRVAAQQIATHATAFGCARDPALHLRIGYDAGALRDDDDEMLQRAFDDAAKERCARASVTQCKTPLTGEPKFARYHGRAARLCGLRVARTVMQAPLPARASGAKATPIVTAILTQSERQFTLVHMSPERHADVLAHCERLLLQFYACAAAERAVSVVTDLYFWLSLATFYARGSSAISKWFALGAFAFLNVTHCAPDAACNADLDALLARSRAEFAQRFEAAFGLSTHLKRLPSLAKSATAAAAAVYATHSANGALCPHVRHAVQHLAAHFGRVFVAHSGYNADALLALKNVGQELTLVETPNRNFDFGKWRHVCVERADTAGAIQECTQLCLCNDSVLFCDPPLDRCSKNARDATALARMSALMRGNDVWGVTRCSRRPAHFSENICDGLWHLQSYFLVYATPAAVSAARDYLQTVASPAHSMTHTDVVLQCEIPHTPFMLARKLRVSSVVQDYHLTHGNNVHNNASVNDWRDLLALDVPFLKVKVARGDYDSNGGVQSHLCAQEIKAYLRRWFDAMDDEQSIDQHVQLLLQNVVAPSKRLN